MTKRILSRNSFENSPKKMKDTADILSTFFLKQSDDYKGTFPIYKQPQELTSYSIDENRQVWFDNREMRYYYPPTNNDLNVGFDKLVCRDDTIPEHIDSLLDALTEFRGRNHDPENTSADFITWRGILAKMLCTPYSRREPWELRATRYKGSIYIEEQVTEYKKNMEGKADERQRLMSYWGYRFETLCTVKKPPSEIRKDDIELRNRETESANTNQQYCVVVKTRLGQSSIIMGAEVDCCLDEKPTNPSGQLQNYIELKTSRVIETNKHQYSFDRYKLLKFWAQSFLVGVPRIMCGFRDDNGQIKHIQKYKTLEIPRMVREKSNTWDASVCLNFADQLLDWIKGVVVVDDPTTTYAIKFEYPFNEITASCTHQCNIFLTKRFLVGKVEHKIGGERAGEGRDERDRI
ncbi:RAI1 like PD-XK nuclease-domain-containing protein [Pilobolus umbonatus]|nr:RAI1 like PD-XK nuclease-domain-containing protein [Pilobolus umbonatus]